MKDLHLKTDPVPDFTRHIPDIVRRSGCQKHIKDKGEPCYAIVSDNGVPVDIMWGVCNGRARSAGFAGKISEGSIFRQQHKNKKK